MRNLMMASLSLVLFSACGDDSTPPDMTVPADLSIPDLLPPRDLTTFDFKGVTCTTATGPTTCDENTQECCLMVQGTSAAGMCVAKNSCNKDAGASLMCDGPEDCTTGMPSCCVSIGGTGDVDAGTIAGGSGQAVCSNNCPGNAMIDLSGGFSATSKLCHVMADCKGYKGVLDFMGPQTLDFTLCCEAQQAPGFRFCAPSLIQTAGGTCF